MKLSFNAAQVEPSSSFDTIPAGWYTAEITDSEEKDTKAGDGSYLNLTFRVIEGQYMNRLVWARLNLNNKNPTAVEIAQKDLSAICHAINELNLTDSSQLHGKPMKIKVTVRQASGGYEASNEIKAYESAGSSPVASVANNNNNTEKKPWEK